MFHKKISVTSTSCILLDFHHECFSKRGLIWNYSPKCYPNLHSQSDGYRINIGLLRPCVAQVPRAKTLWQRDSNCIIWSATFCYAISFITTSPHWVITWRTEWVGAISIWNYTSMRSSKLGCSPSVSVFNVLQRPTGHHVLRVFSFGFRQSSATSPLKRSVPKLEQE